MNDYSSWLLRLKERMPMLRETFSFCYLTKMAIPWTIAYFILATIAWYEISNLYMAYIILGFSLIVGIILFILMVSSMTEEVKEVQQLRDLYHTFSYNFELDSFKWSEATKTSYIEFKTFLVHICPNQTKRRNI